MQTQGLFYFEFKVNKSIYKSAISSNPEPALLLQEDFIKYSVKWIQTISPAVDHINLCPLFQLWK